MTSKQSINYEKKRLEALHSYNVLDSFAEKDFDDITNIAADLCNAPICLISLVDEKRQWFKSNHGIGIRETSRDISFCGRAIEIADKPFEVKNSSLDIRFKDSPLVIGEPFITYYFGIPLISPEGYALGTLCVIDHKERTLSERQKFALQALAKQVVNLLELRRNNAKINKLLANIFPVSKLKEISEEGTISAKPYDKCTVVFTDFKGFTDFSAKRSAKEVVKELHYLYSNFDSIFYFNKVEKIKTIGDAYMACAGIDTDSKNPALDAIKSALEIIEFMKSYEKESRALNKEPLKIRIGINTGSIISGVVGIKKYSFDIWGNTVNIASHLETAGEIGKINISQSTFEEIKETYEVIPRGKIRIKNNEEIDMYFIK
tara:strand:- start:385 stop:1509 length:1125 start_codon:yes stop_codon:yes gene_type:complete